MARARQWLALVACGLLLSGCMLLAGQQRSSTTGEEAGQVAASFVSAEGQEQREVSVGLPGTVRLVASVTVGTGDLWLDVLRPNGEIALTVNARPEQRTTGFVVVSSDERGRLRYRINARSARDGGYELRWRRQ